MNILAQLLSCSFIPSKSKENICKKKKKKEIKVMDEKMEEAPVRSHLFGDSR